MGEQFKLYSYQAPPRQLAVSRNSWHYRYYLWIRSLFGHYAPPEKSSLCPYFHTILWGSLAAVVFSPLILIGWFINKFIEYSAQSDNPTADRFFSWYAETAGINRDKISAEGSQLCKMSGYVPFMTLFGAFVLSGIGICAILVYMLALGIWNIPDIGSAIWNVVLYGGYYAFEFFGGIIYVALIVWQGLGEGLVHIWGGITDAVQWCGSAISAFFSWIGSWLFAWSFWKPILKWGGIVIGGISTVGGAAVGIGYAGMTVAKSSVVLGLGAAFSRMASERAAKRADIVSAREAIREEKIRCRAERNLRWSLNREARASKRKKKKEQAKKWQCQYCKYWNAWYLDERCESCSTPKPDSRWWVLLSPFTWLGKLLGWLFGWARTRVVKIGEVRVHVIGGFGLMWELLKSIKYRACPIVDFMTDEDLQARAVAAGEALAAEKKKREEEWQSHAQKLKDERTARRAKWEQERRNFVKSESVKPGTMDNFVLGQDRDKKSIYP